MSNSTTIKAVPMYQRVFIDNPPVLGWLRDGDDETNDQKHDTRD